MLSFTFTISISKGIPAQEPNTVRQGGRNDIKNMTRIYLWGVTFPSFFCFQQIDFNMLYLAAFYSHSPCFKFLSDLAM